MNKYRNLAVDTILFAFGNLLSKLILFFLMPLYTTALVPAQYSFAELINNTGELLLPVVTLCLYDAVFRFSVDEDSNRKEVFSSALATLLKLLIIVFVLAGLFQVFFFNQYTWYLVAILFSLGIRQLIAQFARGIGKTLHFAVSGIINALFLFLFNVLFLLIQKWGVEGYLLSIILSSVVSALYLIVAVRIPHYVSFKQRDTAILRVMLVYSVPMIANTLSWWLVNMAGRYIILWFSGAAVAGLFMAASKLPTMINLLTTIFQQAWQISSSKEIDSEESGSFFSNVFKLYSSVILFASSTLIFLTPVISKIILRNEFFQAWVYVPLLLLSATLNCYSAYYGSLYVASKKSKMVMISVITGAIINIAICLLTVPLIGAYGASIASCVSYLAIVIIRVIDTRKYVSVTVNWRVTIWGLSLLTVQAIVVTLGTRFSTIVSASFFIAMAVTVAIHLRKEILRGWNLLMHAMRK